MSDENKVSLITELFGEVGNAMINSECVIIFPEATTLMERNALWAPFERGSVLMISRAESKLKNISGAGNDIQTDIPIVPIGIRYEWPNPTIRSGKPNLYFRIWRPFFVTKQFGTGPGAIEKAHQYMEGQVKQLSQGGPATLNLKELRTFDDQKAAAKKEEFRNEFVAKELLGLIKSPELAFLKKIKPTDRLDQTQSSLFGIWLRGFARYIELHDNFAEKTAQFNYARKMSAIASNVVKYRMISKPDLDFVYRVVLDERCYKNRERKILHNIDVHLQKAVAKVFGAKPLNTL